MVDLSEFYRDDRPREYRVRIVISATVDETVFADSPEEARQIVEQRLEDGEIDAYGSDFEDARIQYCVKTPPMFCIKRPGTNVCGASNPREGDIPRLPFEHEKNAYKPEQSA